MTFSDKQYLRIPPFKMGEKVSGDPWRIVHLIWNLNAQLSHEQKAGRAASKINREDKEKSR